MDIILSPVTHGDTQVGEVSRIPSASNGAPSAKGRIAGSKERGWCLMHPMNQAGNCIQLSHSANFS